MSISQAYLIQKSRASGQLINRMSAIHKEISRKRSRVEGISGINEMCKGLVIKKSVIDVMVSLYDEKNNRTTDNVFKAINSAMFYCAHKPHLKENKILQGVFRARLNTEQVEAVKALLILIKNESSKEKRVLMASRMLGQFVRERSSRLVPNEVENIVLAGGGAKGFSLSKIPSALDACGVKNIKRIAGTSAGSILGSMMALGYSSDALESIVLSNQFGLFTVDSRFSNPVVDKISERFPISVLKPFSDNAYAKGFHKAYVGEMLLYAAKETALLPEDVSVKINRMNAGMGQAGGDVPIEEFVKHRSSIHKALYREVIKPLVTSKESANLLLSMLLKVPDDVRRDLSGIATQIVEANFGHKERYFTQLYPSTEQGLKFAVREMSGQDLIVSYFEDLFEDKLAALPEQDKRTVFLGPEFKHEESVDVPAEKLRRVTFSQLKRLHEIRPNEFKEFYCTIALAKKGAPEGAASQGVLYQHHDVSHQHKVLKNMAIADAVRVSMNLPVIYPAFEFEVDGKRYRGADGGVLSNLSIHVFDDKFAPEKSMCFIYAEDKEISKAENLYQILVHPRSAREINRDIEKVREELSDLADKRQKLTRIVKSQKGKEKVKNGIMIEKMVSEAQYRIEVLTEKMDTLRFRRQVLDYEADNVKLRSWIPFNISDQLANKRHRGQYLPQDLNRTVLINTGSVGTLDFKIKQLQKRALMKSGERATIGVLSGRDDLELSFLRDKCEDFEIKLAQEKLVNVSRHIWSKQAPTESFTEDIEFVFHHAYTSIKDKNKRKILQAGIESTLMTEERLTRNSYNKSLAVARNLWRDVLTYQNDALIL